MIHGQGSPAFSGTEDFWAGIGHVQLLELVEISCSVFEAVAGCDLNILRVVRSECFRSCKIIYSWHARPQTAPSRND